MNSREAKQRCRDILKQTLSEVASNDKDRTDYIRRGVRYELKEALLKYDGSGLISLAGILRRRADQIRDLPELQALGNKIADVLIKIAEALVPEGFVDKNVIFVKFKPVPAKSGTRGECGKIIQFPIDWLNRMRALDPSIKELDMEGPYGLYGFFEKYTPPTQKQDDSKK